MIRARAPRALTIAGSDSGAGAGVQADLKTFAARGVYGTSVIAALTAQSSRGVHGVAHVRPAFVHAQLEAVLDDFGADAVKTGMLLDAAVVATVARVLATHRIHRLVVDPVMRAKDGARLLAPSAERVLAQRLVPLATVLTPNLAEASALVGFPVDNVAAMEEAARLLARRGPEAVVVKGGHLRGDPVDVLLWRGELSKLRGSRVAGPAPHGTGCTFSAAIAAELAKGAAIDMAVRAAKRYTTTCIRRARRLGRGRPVLGHFPTRGAR